MAQIFRFQKYHMGKPAELFALFICELFFGVFKQDGGLRASAMSHHRAIKVMRYTIRFILHCHQHRPVYNILKRHPSKMRANINPLPSIFTIVFEAKDFSSFFQLRPGHLWDERAYPAWRCL